MTKIITIEQVGQLSKQIKKENNKIVVAGGCFDMLHIGHITLLENAKDTADVLMVLLESDDTIKKKGANRPIHTQQQRAELVAALRAVDVIVLLPKGMKNADYDSLLQSIKPTVIATTKDDLSILHKERQAELVGAKIIAVNKYIPSVSTSKLLTILSEEI